MQPTTTVNNATMNELIERARAAMRGVGGASQGRVDELVTAVAWALYQPHNARRLAELAVSSTGLGNADDKVAKNRRKTFGALRDLMRVKTVGVIETDAARGVVKYGKPVGVVAAVTPSTNPSATPVNKTMFALKGGNAIVIAPSPAGWAATEATVKLMREALQRIDAPPDLVQILPQPVTREATAELMRCADLVVATGSQNNVRAAYSSGTPCIGVGAGNVPVIIDAGADLDDAAAKICASKTFDNGTSCSSENALIILDAVYDDAITALQRAGGYLVGAEDKNRIRDKLWVDGKLNRELVATDASVFAQRVGIDIDARDGNNGNIDNNGDIDSAGKSIDNAARFFMVEEAAFDPASPFADEKLSLVLTVYRADDFNHAVETAAGVLSVCGRGHSCGIHTRDRTQPPRLAAALDVVRVLVNQSHTFGNGGSFNNALNFTLSMGCGTWGGNSISENLNYRHFINITHLVETIAEDKPSEEELFGAFFAKYGRG